MLGTKTIDELWAEIRNSPRCQKICPFPNSNVSQQVSTTASADAVKLDTSSGVKPDNAAPYYSPLWGHGYSHPMADFHKRRNERLAREEAERRKKLSFKFDPPTFKYKAENEPDGVEEAEDEKKLSDTEETNENGKRPAEEEEDEWIQSPFCGDRYRKKDVDLLVAFANKYIKREAEAAAKRRKLEEEKKEDGKNEEKV